MEYYKNDTQFQGEHTILWKTDGIDWYYYSAYYHRWERYPNYAVYHKNEIMTFEKISEEDALLEML